MRDRGLYFLLHIKQCIMCPWVCLAAPSPYGIDREGSRVILQWVCVTALGSRFLQWAVNLEEDIILLYCPLLWGETPSQSSKALFIVQTSLKR